MSLEEFFKDEDKTVMVLTYGAYYNPLLLKVTDMYGHVIVLYSTGYTTAVFRSISPLCG